MKYSLKTPKEVEIDIAKRVKELRLLKKWKRVTMAERSGVTEASLKRFEQTGKVSFENFLKLTFALGRLDEVDELLKLPIARSIEELEHNEKKIPKRGSV